MNDRSRLIYRAWRYRWKLDCAEIRFLRQTLRPGQVALDIGAHKGAYTYWMLKAVGPRGRVVSFEPQRDLAQKLAQTTRRMGFGQSTVERLGLSSRDGRMELAVPAGGPSPCASLDLSQHSEQTETRPVPVRKLDTYLSDRGMARVDFIKCDVEGHEIAVFQGGQSLLSAHHPTLLFECEVRHQTGRSVGDVFGYLESLGYTGFFLEGRSRRPISEFDPGIHQARPGRSYLNNFVFVGEKSDW